MKEFSRSKTVLAALWILGIVAAVFVVFSLGIYVGYEKALFAEGHSQSYYQAFYGDHPGFGPGPMEGFPGNAHGIVGTVIDITSSSIAVRDGDNDEASVEILPDTIIRRMADTIDETGIQTGDGIAVIGEPNISGQIEARFIRIFPAS